MKRKIAWIVYGSLDERTGGTIYDAQIVNGLRLAGDQVDVISLSPAGAAGSTSHAVVRQLRRLSPSVIVGDELCFRELAGIWPHVAFARRVLLVHHLTCWEEELRRAARTRARCSEAKALRHADALIATSQATRERLMREGHRGRIIDVVLPGADRLPLHPRAPHHLAGKKVFLFIGSIIKRKRVRELVDAFSFASASASAFASGSKPSWELRLAGSRDREPAYVRDIGVHENVIFLDEIGEHALAMELANADVLVMPSSLEGYGIAATEALHAGVPVIAARTAGLEEALHSCGDAVRFFDHPRELARAMQDAVVDSTRLREAAMEARARLPTWSEAVSAFRRALS